MKEVYNNIIIHIHIYIVMNIAISGCRAGGGEGATGGTHGRAQDSYIY